MWIIPKNLNTLASVQDTEALISDLNELSALSEQSLLVRSSTTQRRTWSQRLKRDSLTSRLSGRTLRPSNGARFVDEWTSSLGASLVSHLAPPDNAQETATPDTYGHTSHEGSESWDDLPLFSLRTWTASSAPSSQAPSGQTPQARPFCSMSSASWSAWVTGQRREYSARAKSAPHISAGACSYLAYEMTSTSPRALLFQGCLNAQGGATSPRGPLDEEPRNMLGSPHESRGQLNPRWVETLMGLPVGWTMATCASPWTIALTSCDYLETESSPPQQSELSASSGRGWGTPRVGMAEAGTRTGARSGFTASRLENQVQEALLTTQVHLEEDKPWATPKAGVCGMTARTSGRPIEKSTPLTTQVHLEECKLWGTPRVGASNAPGGGGHGVDAPYRLENQVKEAWPTPQARDHKGSSGRSNAGEELDPPAAVQHDTRPRVPPSDLAD